MSSNIQSRHLVVVVHSTQHLSLVSRSSPYSRDEKKNRSCRSGFAKGDFAILHGYSCKTEQRALADAQVGIFVHRIYATGSRKEVSDMCNRSSVLATAQRSGIGIFKTRLANMTVDYGGS